MPRFHPKDAVIYLDEVDFSAVMNSVEINVDAPPGDVTAFADTDATFVEGKPGWTADVSGLWSGASPNYDNEIFGDLTSASRALGIYPGGASAGNRGYEGTSLVSRDGIVGPTAAVIGLDVTWRGETPLVRSQLLYKATAVAATADGTAYQHGAVSATQKVYGVLRLLASPGGAGSNTCNVIIESDSAEGFGASPATQLTFTELDQSSAALFETKEANGAITDTWWRVGVTIAGGGSRTFNLVLTMGIIPQ